MTTSAENWFGDYFRNLHPRLQELHRAGGVLSGEITIRYGSGSRARWMGRKVASRFGLPEGDTCQVNITVQHVDDNMHWIRQFDNGEQVHSIFTPIGNYPDGYWLETTGNMQLKLGVVIDRRGGWLWQTRGGNFAGLPLPKSVFPTVKAGKSIIDNDYAFSVTVAVPGFGFVLGYQGMLQMTPPHIDVSG